MGRSAQGPEYKAALKAFQPLIDGVERAKSDSDLIALLGKISKNLGQTRVVTYAMLLFG